jgi:hypothetical protein
VGVGSALSLWHGLTTPNTHIHAHQSKPEYVVPRPTGLPPPAVARYPRVPALYALRTPDGRRQLSEVAMDTWLRALAEALAGDTGAGVPVVDVPLRTPAAAPAAAPATEPWTLSTTDLPGTTPTDDPHGLRRLRRPGRIRALAAAAAAATTVGATTIDPRAEGRAACTAVLPDRRPPDAEAALRYQTLLYTLSRRDRAAAGRAGLALAERLAVYAPTIQGALLRSAYPPAWLLAVTEQALHAVARADASGDRGMLAQAVRHVAPIGTAWELLGARMVLLERIHRLCHTVGDDAGPVAALQVAAEAYTHWTARQAALAGRLPSSPKPERAGSSGSAPPTAVKVRCSPFAHVAL